MLSVVVGCALAIKCEWKCSFLGNPRALCSATLSPSALVTGNVSDDSHSLCGSWCEKTWSRSPDHQRWKVAWARKKIPSGFGYFASLDHVLMGRVGTFEIFFFWGNLKLCLTPENDVNPVLLTNAL